jgi:hypothetical protein
MGKGWGREEGREKAERRQIGGRKKADQRQQKGTKAERSCNRG